jgi:Cu+-exporting ATPase
MLQLAASAEQGSEHPLASAVVLAAQARNIRLYNIPPSAIEFFHGQGVQCKTSEGIVLVGNRSFMESKGLIVGPLADSAMWDLEIQGKTAIIVALDGKLLGILGIADAPKPESFNTIASLRTMGIDIWMITGDNRTTAGAVAEQLDIPKDRVMAGDVDSCCLCVHSLKMSALLACVFRL